MIFAARLEAFEGPLDLLLHLIDKNKVDIYDIPISDITDQYLEYLDNAEEVDAEVMSEFLVMAATLLDIKARMLLPKEEDSEGNEIDPRAELVEKLLEYKMYKYMSVELRDRSFNAAKALYKEASIPSEVIEYESPVDLDMFLGDTDTEALKKVFEDVMDRALSKVNSQAMLSGQIKREEISLTDKIDEISRMVRLTSKVSFQSLLGTQITRINIIVTFLAVLELMKTGEIIARQSSFGTDITLYPPEVLNDKKESEISD